MIWKIFLVGALVIGVMAMIKDGRVLRDAGVLGKCNAISVNGELDPTRMSCSKGLLNGFPNLSSKSCSLTSTSPHREVWRCPVPSGS